MTIIVETRYGTMECLEGDSIVSRSLDLYGEWAQHELSLMALVLRPDDVALDVGAFLGTHTLAFSRMVGPGGIVHSFEPRASIRKILQGNAARNGLSQVAVHACALGESAGELEIDAVDIHDAMNFGGLAVEASELSFGALTETIFIQTLDEFDFPQIDLLKIDAEGMEADVLTGGHTSLKKHRPVIFAECNDLAQGSRTWDALRRLDYAVYGVVSPAFDQKNFRGELHNIFPDAVEVSLLALPANRESELRSSNEIRELPLIDSLDALALLLLHKPQYADEVWGNSPAAAALGLYFKTPLSRRLRVQLDETTTEAHAWAAAKQTEITTLQATLCSAEQEAKQLREEIRQLRERRFTIERYLPGGFLHLWRRMRAVFR